MYLERLKTLNEREELRRKRAERKGRFVYLWPTEAMMLNKALETYSRWTARKS